MTDPIRTALVGYGKGGQLQFAPHLVASPDYELTTVVTRDPVKADAVRRLSPTTRVVDTVEEVWNRPHDLVAVSTPNATHVEIASEAISRGVPVLLDKPMAVSAAAARELIARAESAGVLLEIFQNRRWDGDFLTLQSLIARGELGDVRVFESRFGWWDPQPAATWKAAATVQEGGGALFDMGPHLLDQAIQLFGPIESWYAELDAWRPASAADDDLVILVTHRSGVRTRLWTSCVERDFGARFRVVGSRASYTLHGLDPQERQAQQGMPADDPDFGVDDSRVGRLVDDDGGHAVPTLRGQHRRLFDGLAESLRDGAPLPVRLEDSVAVLEIIDAIHAGTSIRSHR
jgi:predicted dehydrogenase